MSSASTNAEADTNTTVENTMSIKPERVSLWRTQLQEHTFAFLLAFRLLNALTVKTFFQPDEYYQSLEPAWWLAFGDHSGAWITWEWQNQLRSALHPALFAFVYATIDSIATNLGLSDSVRSTIFLAAPKVIQACLAALGDFYSYKLAQQIYGKSSISAWYTLLLTIGSAWHWFCATRTFSNCAETTLTIIALYNWPFHWALGADEVGFQVDDKVLRLRQTEEPSKDATDESTRLRRALFCAAIAVILRPTNVIIWITLTLATFGRGMWHHGIHWEVNAFIKEGLLCGSTVLVLSALVDRLFYQTWAFPPWNFLKFNVFQSLAVFYGNNNWHYYLSQGYPLLLTAAIVPAAGGLQQSLIKRRKPEALGIESRLILHRLAIISLTLPAMMSILSHKEVRFIYPILPALHILAAMPLAKFLNKVDASGREISPTQSTLSTMRRILLVSLVFLNVAIALYTSTFHNSGIITVTDYFRSEYETRYEGGNSTSRTNLTFAALMPCHSIPWRSHIQHPATVNQSGISGWALTCEPPLNLNVSAKAAYLDEADVFYLDPLVWINRYMSLDLPPSLSRKPGVYASNVRNSKKLWSNPNTNTGVWLQEGQGGSNLDIAQRRRAWPDYIIFFQQLEPIMQTVLANSAYTECQRFFNSHGHDDWRRKGDVVVWCTHSKGLPK